MRIGFTECENLDPIFKNIGDIIGMSIEHIIFSSVARATRVYTEILMPPEIREGIVNKQIDRRIVNDPVYTYARIMGFGKCELLDFRYKGDADDYSKYRYTKPYSLPLNAGSLARVLSALLGHEYDCTHEEISPGVYEFTTSWAEFPEVMEEKLPMVPYHHRDGDLELERCATCGGPIAFSGYRWDLDEGLIIDGQTGRRMAILGPESLDRLFEVLECRPPDEDRQRCRVPDNRGNGPGTF